MVTLECTNQHHDYNCEPWARYKLRRLQRLFLLSRHFFLAPLTMRITHGRQPQVNANGRHKRRSNMHSVSSQPRTAQKHAPRRPLPLPPSPTVASTRYDPNVAPECGQRQRQPYSNTDSLDEQCVQKFLLPLHTELKHTYSDSNADIESNTDDPTSPLINKQYWKKKGLILGRLVEMWDTFCQIIDEGVSRDPGVDEDFMHTDL